MESQRTLNSQNVLEKIRTKLEDSYFLILNLLKTYINQEMWYWHKERHTDQWNKMENIEINLAYHQLIFNKVAKTIQQGAKSCFNKWHWINQISTFERMKWDPQFILCTKINSKGIIDLSIRTKKVKLRKKCRGKSVSHNDLFDTTLQEQRVKEKNT